MFNVSQYFVVVFGVMWVGLIVVNINFLYIIWEMEYQFNDFGVKVFVVLVNMVESVEKVLLYMGIEYVIVIEIVDMYLLIKCILMNVVIKYVKKMVFLFNIFGVYKLFVVLGVGVCEKFMLVECKKDDIVVFQYIGGIMGVVKGVMFIYGNLVVNLM